MKNRRLGKFRFSDYILSLISIVLLFFFSVAGILLKQSALLCLFPAICAVIRLVKILIPQCEQFILNHDSITVFLFKRIQTISLPDELTLIVSYADVAPPFAVRTAVGNQTHILKDKYTVSILQKMPKDAALEKLHRNGIKKYTAERIKTVFDASCYIYSFVLCSRELPDVLITDRKCLLIVPESLSDVISFKTDNENVYIDKGY